MPIRHKIQGYISLVLPLFISGLLVDLQKYCLTPLSMRVVKKQDDLRYPQEHVFLVNCIGSNDAQSEAAYYSNAPAGDPETIAVVTTPSEGLTTWEDSTTTTTFTDAGSTHKTGFTVTLGPRPADGQIAGNASNTYDTAFACYAQASTLLYTSENRNCYSVYDCSHADRVSESVGATSPITTLTSTKPITTTTSPTATTQTSSMTVIETTPQTTSMEMTSTTTTATRLTSSPTPTSASSTPSETTTALSSHPTDSLTSSGTAPSSPSSRLPQTMTVSIPTKVSLTSSSTETPSPSLSPSPSSSHSSQVGTAIGIGIGVTIGTILLAITSISLLRKYWAKRSAATADGEVKSNSSSGLDNSRSRSRSRSSIYEAGGTALPVELAGCSEHVHELEAKPLTAGRGLGWGGWMSR
ncbi:hypothetical protein F5Y12DRAFT_28979 [Xylaria sp. FL1777]|nr:hypothetical protein F5Y12DRAFT_28979 [Xylaria sp. FL1777]